MKETTGRNSGLNMFYSSIIANNIRYFIQKYHLSVARLAERLDTPRMTVYLWINEQTTPGIHYLVKLSEIFGCTIDDIVKVDQTSPKAKREFAEKLQELKKEKENA